MGFSRDVAGGPLLLADLLALSEQYLLHVSLVLQQTGRRVVMVMAEVQVCKPWRAFPCQASAGLVFASTLLARARRAVESRVSCEGLDMGPFLLSVTLPTLSWSNVLDVTLSPDENGSEPTSSSPGGAF